MDKNKFIKILISMACFFVLNNTIICYANNFAGFICPPLSQSIMLKCENCKYEFMYEKGVYEEIFLPDFLSSYLVKLYKNQFFDCPKCGEKQWKVVENKKLLKRIICY